MPDCSRHRCPPCPRRTRTVAEPPLGEPPLGEPPLGEPALGEPALGEPALGEPALGEPALGEPALGEPALGEPALGEPALGEPAWWAVPAAPPDDFPAAPPLPPELEVLDPPQPAATPSNRQTVLTCLPNAARFLFMTGSLPSLSNATTMRTGNLDFISSELFRHANCLS